MTVTKAPRSGFHLLDLAALVVGYSLASLLIRAFWPSGETLDAPALGALAIAYLWLGVAMSGPIVLLGRRRGGSGPVEDGLPEPRSWSELAWLIIGFYWIGLTILVVPVRLPSSRVLDSAFLGLFPVLAAFGLRFIRPRARDVDPNSKSEPDEARRDWTHQAAVGLLATWPFAWVALILLGKNMP